MQEWSKMMVHLLWLLQDIMRQCTLFCISLPLKASLEASSQFQSIPAQCCSCSLAPICPIAASSPFFLSLLDPWKDGQFQHVSRRLSFAISLRSLFGSDLQWHSHTTVDSYHSSWVHTTVPCCTRPGVSAHQLWWKITDVACTSYRKLPAMDCWAVSWFVSWLHTYIILYNIPSGNLT